MRYRGKSVDISETSWLMYVDTGPFPDFAVMGDDRINESKRLKSKMNQTPEDRYISYHRDVVALLELLRRELRIHKTAAMMDRNDWGFASELGHVRQSLKDLVLFLILSRFDSKTAAVAFIENRLELKK